MFDYFWQKKLKALVAWSVLDEYKFRSFSSIQNHVSRAQYILKIPIKYQFEDDEWKIVNELISGCQHEIVQRYFNDELPTFTCKSKITGEMYFMFLLQEYLSKHQCDYDFLGHDMHKKLISTKSYDTGFVSRESSYYLSNFAIVLNKLYYVSHIYCKNCKELSVLGIQFSDAPYIQEILDTNTITVEYRRGICI
nr:hypothetical protein [uncultured Ruminococcus sp.]